MKNRIHIQILTMSILFVAPAFAVNPFLDAKDDRPVSANFRGTEWNDENIQGEIPLTARMITTRVASMSWGAIFKIEFVDLKSRAKQRREIPPQYFIATDDRIVLLNEENNDAAARKISAMEKQPAFEEGDIRAIASGKLNFEEGPYTTKIDVKVDECTYLTSHNSGHFTKFVWKKGVGLIEHSGGYGAMKDGFRLKRAASKT
ncbi:MAG: hypothetical protein DME63_06805 [Verrucomicrobia bacterium]|nr:MAG: hypothetical protein DME63_06805 [Verrucomicrobiota bacterium]